MLTGKKVIVRSNMSGVWHGICSEFTGRGSEGVDIILSDASKIHYWKGAEATSGLALKGPGEGSRVCTQVPLVLVTGCCEVILATSEANKAIKDCDRWTI